MDGALSLVGGPASAFLSGADGCVDFAGGLPLWWHPQPFLLARSLSE